MTVAYGYAMSAGVPIAVMRKESRMSYSCSDVCSDVEAHMCVECPDYEVCHEEDCSNHRQMLYCISLYLHTGQGRSTE